MTHSSSKEQQDTRRRHPPASGPGSSIFWAIAVVAVALVAWLAWPSASESAPGAGAFEEFGLHDDPYIGNPSAPVVLVGYESPHCGACQHFHQNVLPRLRGEFFDAGAVAYYYIEGTIGGDWESSIAQECAHRVGGNDAFWSLSDRLYARGYTYSTPPLDEWLGDLATAHDLDETALLDCYHGRETESAVLEDLRVGRDHGAAGTPTFWTIDADGKVQRVTNWSALESVLRELVNSGRAESAPTDEPTT